ncbi:MAG: response regulator [Synergistaceae bacterium]|nr:response regulator [Synergistaceae bacterium]
MNGKRVLIAGGGETFLCSCKALLEANGCEAETAPDIRGARALVRSRPPDAVILDAALPGGRALDLCREIRASRSVPILFVTGPGEPGVVVDCLNAGGDACLTKPVEFSVLKAHLEALFRRASAALAPGAEEKIRPRREPYFFPQRLKNKLARMRNYPLTIVEAPSGFGKTTAVREYLKNLVAAATATAGARIRENWYTCLGESPKDAWAGICRLFAGPGEPGEAGNLGKPGESGKKSEKNDEAARRLSELFPPTMESLPGIAASMREYRCDDETFLVIDNYQLFENGITPQGAFSSRGGGIHLINAFSAHTAPNLHIIVITQSLPLSGDNVHNSNIYRLGAGDFFFDRDSTARVCRLAGVRLSDEELDKVQGSSEGWVAAIMLQAASYKESGSFVNAGSLDDLMEKAIWNRMSGVEREFLMSVSLLNGFTARQAAMMGDWPVLPENAARLLEDNFFIPYIADKGVYSIHSLLRDYLQKRFGGQQPVFIETMNRRAGKACEAASDYIQAARFFLKTGDHDAVLSMPFTPRYLYEHSEDAAGFLECLAEECPDDALLKYPFTMIAFAFQFLKDGKRDLFSRMIRLLGELFSDSGADKKRVGDLPEDEFSRVKGETALLMSFTVFNDIEKMSGYHRKALALLGERQSSAILGVIPWTFGAASVLHLFWSRAGELDRELSLMDECLPFYSSVTSGHGTGADSVFRAEASLMRGDDAEAEAACYRAIYKARSEGQTAICLCASLVLARAAILRGDGAAYAAVRGSITKYPQEARRKIISRMSELCLASLGMILGDTRDIPEWLRDAGSIRRAMYALGHSYAFTLHGRMLLLEKRRAELYGMTGPLLDMARGMNYLLPQVYHLIYLAAAKKSDGVLDQAAEYLNAALDIALPDRVYLPFAEFGATLAPLLEAAKNTRAKDRTKINAVIELYKRFSSGAAAVIRQNERAQTSLTPREREIALLARERLSAGEIASRFFISENTVRSALKAIYSKLGIHSKSGLTGKDF